MFCAARRKTRAKRAEIRSAQQKRPCQPKTAKRFFGGPASQGPSGQAKEQTRILPVRRGFSAPGVPRHVAGWSSLHGLPLLCPFSPAFSSILLPCEFFCRRSVCGAFAATVWPVGLAAPGAGRCRRPAAVREVSRRCARILWRCFPACVFDCRFCALPAVRLVCTAFLSCLSPFPASLFPLKILFTCRSGRDGPLLSSEKKVDKDSQRGFAPLNPIPVPCGCSFLLPRCWPA